jgi:hypothetical protein
MGQRARFARRDIAKQVRDDAMGQFVGLNGIVHRQLLQRGHETPVPAHHPLDQAGVSEVVESPGLAVPLAGGVDQRQLARRADPRLQFGCQKPCFEGDCNLLCKTNADEAAGGNGVAIVNEPNRLCGGHDLVASRSGADMFVDIEVVVHGTL